MIPCKKDDIVEAGLARLTTAYRDKPAIRALLAAFLRQMQILEDATWDVINGRLIGTVLVDIPATPPDCCECPVDLSGDEALVTLDTSGAALTTLAKLVGEPRFGRSDDELLVAMRSRIRINTSDGLAEDIIKLVRGALPTGATFTYDQPAPASLRVTAFGLAAGVANGLARAIGTARMGGVRGVLESSSYPLSKTLHFASDYGTSDNRGFASDYSATFESRYAHVQETTP